MMNYSGWSQDFLWECAFLVVVSLMLWRTDDSFTVCDGASKFGSSKSDAALRAQVRSGHGWGEQCTPVSALDNAGFTRKISSECLHSATHSYEGLCSTVLVFSTVCVAAASINDLILWRNIDSGMKNQARNCRVYLAHPTMLISALLAIIFSIIMVKRCHTGWTCETNDSAAWIFVTIGSDLSYSLGSVVLMLVLLVLRLMSVMIGTALSVTDGQGRFMIHKPVWTASQVRGAYGESGELDPLIAGGDANSRVPEVLRPWLVAFYRQNNPEKLQFVDQILANYVGHEELLYQEIHEKYEVEAGEKQAEEEIKTEDAAT
jgi:hypothetical protein